MRNLLILLIGLILFSLLGYVCIYHDKANTIQADISERANTLLKDDIAIAGDAIEAKVEGRDITLTGTVISETMKQKAEEVAKVHGYRSLDNQLTVVEPAPVPATPKPPYHFSATKSESKQVVLEGFVPSSDIQRQLVTQVQAKFGTYKVTDKLVVTPDATRGWLQTVQATLLSLAVLDSGKISLVDEKLEVSGEARSEKIIQQVKTGISDGIPSNHQVSFDLTLNSTFAPTLDPTIDTSSEPEDVPDDSPKESKITKQEEENTACQKQFEQLLAENTILFKTSSAIISAKSLGLLNQLVEVTQACSTQTISVEGHTDATGPSQLNQRLSKLRAESVINYLVKKGIDKRQLQVQGHGESNPIADNATKQGRTANRRIEFIVKEVE